jgi:hypothetical protein
MYEDRREELQPVTPPRGFDPEWQEKIARAQEAREQGLRSRAGKPASFRHAVGRSW